MEKKACEKERSVLPTVVLVCAVLAGALLRFGLSRSPSVVHTLAGRFEVSTAASGVQRCLSFHLPQLPSHTHICVCTHNTHKHPPAQTGIEGVYALQEGLDPYASGTVHCSPLLLHSLARVLTREDTAQLAALLFPTSSSPAAQPAPPPLRATAVFVLADTCAALALALVARAIQRRGPAPAPTLLASSRWFPAAAAALFALNPLAVAQCVAMSADVLVTAAVLAAVAAAAWGAVLPAAALAALAALCALYPAVLVLPLAALVYRSSSSSSNRRVKTVLFAAAVGACVAALGALCTALDGGARAWVGAVPVFLYRAPDHTPNIGLWWDLLLELFPQFTALFVHVLQLLFFGAYPVAVTLALRRTPLAAVWLLAGSWAVLTPYPSLSHVALHAALHPLVVAAHVHAPQRRAAALRTVGALGVVAAVLAVLLASATRGWLYTGTGNVNFYYAGVLVLQGAQTYWLAATSETVLRDDYVQRHPPCADAAC